MALGMGTVFAFLVILILMMNMMSKIVHDFFPEPQAEVNPPAENKQDNKKVIAAITAAIAHHRQG